MAELAYNYQTDSTEVKKFVIWGNHSSTMYPDITNCTIEGKKATDIVDPTYFKEEFIPTVQQRGAAIIQARKLSSAASAASASIDHMRDWALGSEEWVSMAVPSDGSYDVPEGVQYSYPCKVSGGKYEIIQGLELDAYSLEKLAETKDELFAERAEVEDML